MNPHIQHLRRTTNLCLWTSLLISTATICFIVFSDYRFYADNRSFLWFGIAVFVLFWIDIIFFLRLSRRGIPKLRQKDNLDDKLLGYSKVVSEYYLFTFFSCIALCADILFTNNTRLIMLLMLAELTLFISFPNMYKMKRDLNISNEDMKNLFGDSYIADLSEDQNS